MAALDLTRRQAMIVTHPIAMGYLWGIGVIALVLLANALFAAPHPLTAIDIAVRALAFAVLSPAWGLLTRRTILRKAEHANG